MYIKSAEITNIRSIDNFKIEFKNPAGWHVLIGDNGSGKSTIIRSMALALVGPYQAQGLQDDWQNWLKINTDEGKISLFIEQHDIDETFLKDKTLNVHPISNNLYFHKEKNAVSLSIHKEKVNDLLDLSKTNWSHNVKGWFSAAYGPYRRFTGGDTELETIYTNKPKLGAHISALNEAAALTEITKWLMKLNYQELEQYPINEIEVQQFDNEFLKTTDSFSKESNLSPEFLKRVEKLIAGIHHNLKFKNYSIISSIKKLINSQDFLPNNTKLEKITSEGVFFKDSNGSLITINQLSDGYRSILSLTLELIRQLIRVYGEEAVFKNIRENDPDKMFIDLPGVVLIDEIDAHLHPTWQTKIGQWFLKYFRNIQFIVTTHSPLVCRAAEKGTIWKLAAPGSNEKSEQVTGVDRQRLIFGNILDAYGTEVFGEDISRSEKSAEMLKELAALSVKSFKGKITDSERKRADQLKQILPTE